MPNNRIKIRALPYTKEMAITLFSPLSSQPWGQLLHSGSARHQHNRFDIFTADPLMTLETTDKGTLITTADKQYYASQDPFSLIDQAINTLGLNAKTDTDLPFQGGALGLWGYDLGRHIEQIPSLAQQDITLPDMAIGIYDWAVIIDHKKQQATLLCHSDIEARYQWLIAAQNNKKRETPFALNSDWQANMNRHKYGEKFKQIKHHISQGDCYQINLTQRFSAEYQGDEFEAFTRLNQSNQAPFSAFMRLPNHTVISVSPERFLHLANNKIETRPIKGTRPRHADREKDQALAEQLANSEKDRSENLMIVDLLRNDIGRIAAPGSVSVPELFIVEPFPAVHHLVSTITAILPQSRSATELLRACFPGGSITGAPKVSAMKIIEQLEPQRRNAYCGAIGYISACGTMDTNITIRTLFSDNNRLYCSVGGGIVADSDVDAEYQETYDKVSRILPLLSQKESVK